MRICITLDDVIRDKTKQIVLAYQKSVNPDIELDQLEITSQNLCKTLGFESDTEYKKFLYEDCVFQVFGEALTCSKMLDKNLNLWLLKLSDLEEEPTVCLASTNEFNTSIGCTCFFLSKIATRVREIFFPKSNSDLLKLGDVIVTSDPSVVTEDTTGKCIVKIKTEYNEGFIGHLEYESLQDLINDDEFIEKVKEILK